MIILWVISWIISYDDDEKDDCHECSKDNWHTESLSLPVGITIVIPDWISSKEKTPFSCPLHDRFCHWWRGEGIAIGIGLHITLSLVDVDAIAELWCWCSIGWCEKYHHSVIKKLKASVSLLGTEWRGRCCRICVLRNQKITQSVFKWFTWEVHTACTVASVVENYFLLYISLRLSSTTSNHVAFGSHIKHFEAYKNINRSVDAVYP